MDKPKLATLSALLAHQYRLKLVQNLAQLGYYPLDATGGSISLSDCHRVHLQMKQEIAPQ